MNRRILRGKVLRRAALATAALLAMRLFFVQQLIAAFLIFSIVFACVAVVALILFALDLAWQAALGRAEGYAVVLGRSMSRGRAPASNSTVANALTPILARRVASHEQETFFQ